jgi:predicted ABC-type ATPase
MDLYIIAGPNGVGKTTFALKFLPKYANCRNFVNADLIAQGISPLSPEAAAIRAGRLVINEIKFFSEQNASFGVETTLSGRSYLRLIQQLKRSGYRVHFFFLFVENVTVALSRIEERVRKGGHDVPEAMVRRRFHRSLRNFFEEYRALADSWYLFDNTTTKPMMIAFKRNTRSRIIDRKAYQNLLVQLGHK